MRRAEGVNFLSITYCTGISPPLDWSNLCIAIVCKVVLILDTGVILTQRWMDLNLRHLAVLWDLNPILCLVCRLSASFISRTVHFGRKPNKA